MAMVNEKSEVKKPKKGTQKIVKAKIIASFSLGFLCFIIIVLTLVTDPIMMMLRHVTQVTKGSLVEEIMSREIESIHVSAYLFNYTNAEAFMAGDDDKLKVEEIGPFTYREYRSNVDIVIDTEKKLLWCTPKVRMEFLPEESIGDPHEINVTVPNIPMLGLASKLSDYPYFTRLGFNVLATQLNSKAIVNLQAYDYLWGYKEPIVSLAHNLMPGTMKFDKMGFLDRIYDTNRKTRLEASLVDTEKFMIRSVNGHTKLQMGEESDPETCTLCNTFENVYEGAGFPLEITKDFPIRIFRIGLCRILDLEYYGTKITSYGAEALVYHFSDNFFTLDNTTDNNGILLLPDCFFGMPMAFSKPHFLDSNPSVYERILGIKPDNKSRGWLTVDPKLGMPLETFVSLQINLVVGDVSANREAKSFSNMVLPVCYLKIEQPPLPDESLIFVNGVYYTGPHILLGIQIFLLIITTVCWSICARLIYFNAQRKKETAMSFTLGNTMEEINSNNLEPLMIEKCDS